MHIKAQLENLEIKKPNRAHDNDSGFDLFAPYSFKIKANERITIPLWVRFELKQPLLFKFLNILGVPLRIEAMIRPKSGRSKDGLECSIGTIDFDFRGFVSCTMHNFSKKTILIEKQEKLCQIVFMPVFAGEKFQLKIVSNIETSTERGQKGFGSSGVK